MICPNPTCGNEKAYAVTFYGTGENKVAICDHCKGSYTPKPIVGLGIRHIGGVNSTGKRTAAHDMDISRRRLAPDGKNVIRDYNGKMFGGFR